MIKHALIIFCFTLGIACTDEEHVTDGTRIVRYPGSKQIKQEVQMKDGKKNGYAKEYYRDGKLKRLQHYVNDSLNDSSLYYHQNGKLAKLQFFKDELMQGCWKDFSKDGQLISEMYFDRGMLDGTSSEYTYRTGRLQTRITFKKGVKDGPEEFYYGSGKPKSKAYFKHGQPCIGLQEWMENGDEIKNDIKFTVTEKNEVLLKNTLSYVVHLSDPKPDDQVYHVYGPIKDKELGVLQRLEKNGNNSFVIDFNIGKGGFVMESVTLAAMRKTRMGNTFIKLYTFNAASNNF